MKLIARVILDCYLDNDIGVKGVKSIRYYAGKEQNSNLYQFGWCVDEYIVATLLLDSRSKFYIGNKIRVEGAKSFAAALEINQTLTKIDLYCKSR